MNISQSLYRYSYPISNTSTIPETKEHFNFVSQAETVFNIKNIIKKKSRILYPKFDIFFNKLWPNGIQTVRTTAVEFYSFIIIW